MSPPEPRRRTPLVALAALGALLAAPAPTRAGDPAPAACVVGQRCGDRCIAWTEVCTSGLAQSAGLAPPPVGGPPTAAAAPQGSSLLGLPAMLPPRGPSFRPDAPEYCLTGTGTDQVPAECMAYYQLGAYGSLVSPVAGAPECLQHLRCAGVCLKEGEVCPAHEPVDMQRTDGRTGETPRSGGR